MLYDKVLLECFLHVNNNRTFFLVSFKDQDSSEYKPWKCKWKLISCVWLFATPWIIQFSPWNSLGQNTGEGSLSLLQEIFPTQESDRGLLHCRRILYQLSYQGSPKLIWSQALLPWWHPSLRNWSFPLRESQPQYIEFTVKVVVKKKMVVV